MKVNLYDKSSGLGSEQISVIQDFLRFCQKNSPLKKDVDIQLLGERFGKMTTGMCMFKDQKDAISAGYIVSA